MPDFQVISLVVANNSDGTAAFKIASFDPKAKDLAFSFEIDMILDISVNNTNLYHLKVDEIDLVAFIWANASE